MKLLTRALSLGAHLPRPAYPQIDVERDLRVPMPDGAVLLADRWSPRGRPDAPIVLARSPYGRRALGLFAEVIAGQGYQVIIQSVRGTFGSDGAWEPFFNEKSDGTATLVWLAEQSWFTDRVATFGLSYLGLTQWSIAADPPAWLRGMAIGVSATSFRDAVVHPGNAFGLDLAMSWIYGLESQEKPLVIRRTADLLAERALIRGSAAIPVSTADQALVGRKVGYFQDWVDHEQPGDAFWDPVEFGRAVETAPPISMVAGWYDIFLPQQLADHENVVAAGRSARLTVGPWYHSQLAGMLAMVKDAVDLYRVVLDGEPVRTDDAVRVFVMGSDAWRTFPAWPPTPSEVRRLDLCSSGVLGDGVPSVTGSPTTFRYDPTDPTPAAGGRALKSAHAGARNQEQRERRDDVLTFTTDALTATATVIGTGRVTLTLRTSTPWFDLFLRLCDVTAGGTSTNVCDVGVRLGPDDVTMLDDGRCTVAVALAPTARAFLPGHRIRLQISGGAHPLMSLNPGEGRRLREGVPTEPTTYEVFHDPDIQSWLELPIVI